MSEALVRVLAADLILVLKALHSLNIVYRDLKPRSLMLDGQGHLCLTD